MDYLAMICDIRGSRLLKNRKEVQYQLINTLKEANLIFSNIIVCPFVISAGDEWEGLLHVTSDYHIPFHFFENKLGNIKFYCGIGIGAVTIDDFTLPTNQLDGPAFSLARRAVTLAKEMDSSLIVFDKEQVSLISQ